MDPESTTDVSEISGVTELTDALAIDADSCATDSRNRRRHQRVFCDEQNVRLSIRLRGDLRSHRAELLDLSSYGAAISVTRPLTADRTAFLTVSWGEHRIKDLVVTVSNCLQTSKTNALLTGYRCGLSFRPSSPLQLDRQETVKKVGMLADALANAGSGESQGPLRAEKHSDQVDQGTVEPLNPSGSTPLPQDQPTA